MVGGVVILPIIKSLPTHVLVELGCDNDAFFRLKHYHCSSVAVHGRLLYPHMTLVMVHNTMLAYNYMMHQICLSSIKSTIQF